MRDRFPTRSSVQLHRDAAPVDQGLSVFPWLFVMFLTSPILTEFTVSINESSCLEMDCSTSRSFQSCEKASILPGFNSIVLLIKVIVTNTSRKPNIKEYIGYTSHSLTIHYTSPPCFLNSTFSFFSAIFRLRSLRPIVAITDVSSTFFTHTSIRAVFPFITYEIPQMLSPLGSSVSPIVLNNTLSHLSSRSKSLGRTPKRYPLCLYSSQTQLPPFTLFSSSHEGVIPFYTQNNTSSLTLK